MCLVCTCPSSRERYIHYRHRHLPEACSSVEATWQAMYSILSRKGSPYCYYILCIMMDFTTARTRVSVYHLVQAGVTGKGC